MGSLKQQFVSQDCPDKNCHMEVNEKATPRDLLRFLGVEDRGVLVVINGKPVDLDQHFHDGDRVVVMNPHFQEGDDVTFLEK